MPAAVLRGWVRDSQRDPEPSNREITLLTFYAAGAMLAAIAGYDSTWYVEVAAPAGTRRPVTVMTMHNAPLDDARLAAEDVLRVDHHITNFATAGGDAGTNSPTTGRDL